MPKPTPASAAAAIAMEQKMRADCTRVRTCVFWWPASSILPRNAADAMAAQARDERGSGCAGLTGIAIRKLAHYATVAVGPVAIATRGAVSQSRPPSYM